MIVIISMNNIDSANIILYHNHKTQDDKHLFALSKGLKKAFEELEIKANFSYSLFKNHLPGRMKDCSSVK